MNIEVSDLHLTTGQIRYMLSLGVPLQRNAVELLVVLERYCDTAYYVASVSIDLDSNQERLYTVFSDIAKAAENEREHVRRIASSLKEFGYIIDYDGSVRKEDMRR